ncbi:MAG: helix-turn-helix domain-containing protein [Deltaproteobacteria bacterium]|nr:helix-turn-helix domain-containing protein [Deltaproteobacteria bacterium]
MHNRDYKTFDDLPLMLTVMDVAAVLGISRTGAYELVQQKDFPSLRIGARIIVPKEQFFRWIQTATGQNMPERAQEQE